MNLIVAVAIILLNLYVAVSTSCQIPCFVLSIHFPDVASSICVEVDSRSSHGLSFYAHLFQLTVQKCTKVQLSAKKCRFVTCRHLSLQRRNSLPYLCIVIN